MREASPGKARRCRVTVSRSEALVVECEEYETIDVDTSLWVSQAHSTIFNSEIDGKDVLRASFQNGRLRLQATSFVGVIPINDWVVVKVRPRVPLANLTRMVRDTDHSVLPLTAFARGYSGRGSVDDWAMDIYTEALIERVGEVLDLGLLRSYTTREDEGFVPHGRIEMGPTMQRFAARGIRNSAAYSWAERTIDTPANRCVKAALEMALAHLSQERQKPRKGDRAKVARLAGYMHVFDDVSDDPSQHFLDDPYVRDLIAVPDSRYYYRRLLDLCLLMLTGKNIALELGGSDVQLDSLLIDTNKLFEKFARVSLARRYERLGSPIEVLDGNTDGFVDLYDVPAQLPSPLGRPMTAVASSNSGRAQPDIVFRTLDGNFVLVAEVRNTVHALRSDLPERGEVEQAVTYALRYGLQFTVLIHPWLAGEKGLVYIGRVRSIDVFDFRLDLSSDDTLDARLEEMADVLATLAGLNPVLR
ncbi:McrC family protein [Leifsonia aquatica]|uniref:McrC family protein n=1 Tax=Leifsonia aquatica TaxID=144185 RepID=UPI001F0549F9|nr:McrC family protein [Leifsonia aquatica]